jgi:integrase
MVSEAEYAQILAAIRDDSFYDLIVTTWETGCRPQESLRVEARHVDLKNQRWVFPKSESKTRQVSRVVYLTDEALQITSRLMVTYPTGAARCSVTVAALPGQTTPYSAHSDESEHASESPNCGKMALSSPIRKSRHLFRRSPVTGRTPASPSRRAQRRSAPKRSESSPSGSRFSRCRSTRCMHCVIPGRRGRCSRVRDPSD